MAEQEVLGRKFQRSATELESDEINYFRTLEPNKKQ